MGQSDPVTHPVNISTIIMNSVKCVAAALMLASSLSTGPESGEMTDMGLLKRILMELLPNHMEPLLKVMELQPHLMEPAETGLDLTTIIIPLLALLGLFLLFPTYVTLTSVRRKRE